MKKVLIHNLKCFRCGHKWVPRCESVAACPRCKSRLWNVPRSKAVKK
jgi:DNA-directed RNA polymerase subunit RPC12/RpoP